MASWSARLRSALVIGGTWAASWFGAGMLLLLIVGPNAADVPFPLFFGLLGFLSGATFSLLLAALARRRTFAELSMARFAGWGALAGVVVAGGLTVLGGIVGELPMLGAVFASAGALCAAGTLAIARRAREPVAIDEAVRPDALEDGDAAPRLRGDGPD